MGKLNKYDGVVFTGSTLRINEKSEEVKKHIEFAKKCFEKEKKIFAACWGLQVTVIAAGGKCITAPKGPHVGIAQNIEINENGKKNKLYVLTAGHFANGCQKIRSNKLGLIVIQID